MDLNTIQVILFVVVLVWSAFSLITYAARRSDNKGALRDLKQSGESLRQLSAEEQTLVQPFLFHPANPDKPASLISPEVFSLTGEFIRHGLETGQGGTTLHDTLGDVDVVLPYDARSFLQAEYNEAEVVMTEKFAIVVALNGQFDLSAGRERELRRQKQHQQWSHGQVGALQDVVDGDAPATDSNAAKPAAEATPTEAFGRVEILSQRDETPAEIGYRRQPGIAFWPSVLWLLVCICLALTDDGASLFWLFLAFALGALALWLTWRKRSLGTPQKVNRSRGVLHSVTLANPDNSLFMTEHLFLGDKVPVNLPAHWAAHMLLPDDGRVEVEMRVEDYGVLRLGQQFSVDEEQRLFPHAFWGRQLSLSLVGLLAGLGLWAVADDLGADLAQTGAWISGNEARSYPSAAALLQDPPGLGGFLEQQGQGRCDLQYRQDGVTLGFDCQRLRWGGDPLPQASLSLDPAVRELYSGTFLRTESNAMLDIMLKTQMYRQMESDPSAIYNMRDIKAQLLVGLSDTVLRIESACALVIDGVSANCTAFKRRFVERLLIGEAEQPETWEQLLKLAQDGALKAKGHSDEAMIVSRFAEELRRQAKTSMQPLVQQAISKALQPALLAQRGGVVLIQEGVYGDLAVSYSDDEDLLEVWGQQQRMISGEVSTPFKVKGMVVYLGRDASDTPEIVLDPSRTLDNPWSALAHVLWLLLALGLVLVHVPLLIKLWRQEQARHVAFQAHFQTLKQQV